VFNVFTNKLVVVRGKFMVDIGPLLF